MSTFLMTDTNFQYCCWRSITGILQRKATSLFDSDLVSLNFTTDLPEQVFSIDECYIFVCFPPHSPLHTADRFQAFVLFNFEFSSYTEPSPVSTYHYFCCFVLLKQRLNCWIMLLLGKERKFWWQLNLPQYWNTVSFQTAFIAQFKRL